MKTQDLFQNASALQTEMTTQLAAITHPADSWEFLFQSLEITRTHLAQLKDLTLQTSFPDPVEEIKFFRHVKPHFLSQYLYFFKLIRIKRLTPVQEKSRLEFLHRQLEKQNACRQKHFEFYQYCLSQDTHLDPIYFLRQPARLNPSLDAAFSTLGDLRLSQLLAGDRVSDYLIRTIAIAHAAANGSLTWTGSKASLIELIYALHATDALNQGAADLKQIAAALQALFQVDLGNYYRVFQEIRQRKINRTSFLDQMKSRFIQRMDALD